MKKALKLSFMLAIVGGLVLLKACSTSDPTPLTIVSITADGVDLNGATSATGVKAGSTIVVTFATNLDSKTAVASNVTLKRDYDQANADLTLTVNGATLTIKPNNSLTNGALYILQLSSALASDKGKTLTAAERNFTTEGVFAPDGAVAKWTFEDTAEDVVGTFDPTANQVVDISYSSSHNAAAGKAASFNGSTSIIEVSNGDQLVNNGDWTLSFWVKALSIQKTSGHFVMGLGAFYGFQFEITGDYSWVKLAGSYKLSQAYVDAHPGSTGYTTEDLWFPGDGKDKDHGGWQGWDYVKDLSGNGGVASLIKDTWAHVVITYDATAKKGTMYINGTKVKSQDFNLWPDGDAKQSVTGLGYSGKEPDVKNELAFGFIQSRAGTMWAQEPWGGYTIPTSNHFKGLLDDIIVYKKKITEAEILLMYNSGK
ncbi:MAG: Ig-like domain-containing protein [Cyclobacteriaceae bacterium]|nr:Ig-like domain-containing protein [Cyclobacteriaceae bacterium]